MSWRWEKEENGEMALVIDGWDKGIAPDPYSGMGKMLGVNLEVPGEVSVGYGLTDATTSGGTLGKPIDGATRYFPSYATPVGVPTGSAQSYAILDDGGQVFESTTPTGTYAFLSSSNSTSGATSKDGIAYWLGYLWKTRGANIDYWNGSTWSTGWKTTLDAGVKHQLYVATNNQLYITNGNSIARIFAPTPSSFDPTSAPTYDFNIAILDLPVTETALSLAEVGGGNTPQSTLLIGGAGNAIYPWDKISSSFSLPIYVADGYIAKMISVNQNAFIFPGNTGGRGRIYITNGSQADLYFKLPDFIYGVNDPYFEWGGVAFHRNNLLFSVYADNNAGSGILLKNWIFALNLGTHTNPYGVSVPEKCLRVISTMTAGSAFDNYATVIIPFINPNTAGFSYLAGQRGTGSTNLISYSATTAGVGGGSVFTDFIPVGTFVTKKTFTQVEYKLRTALAAGENIVISMDSDTDSQQLQFAPTPTTGSLSGYAPVSIQGQQWLQFVASLTGNSTSSGVRLKEIRVR